MPLSWNEIKSRAIAFTKEWKGEASEDAEAKSFWDDFFLIFDIRRRRIATFEHHVKQLNNKDGFIDLFWPATLIVEHKSRGKSLDKAYTQVLDYFTGIPDKQLPQYILVSDFASFRLYDLDNNDVHEFPIEKLTDHIGLFGFIAGYQKRIYKEQDPVNIEAAELMGKLHDKLKAIGYTGHFLELYLVRLLFCLFADDSNIFERGIFLDYIELHTGEDGSDLAAKISQLFQVLNVPKDKRFSNLDEALQAFPYVNGKLFEEQLPAASFDSEMRKLLLACCTLDWGKISPAIFGSLFQSVMNPVERRTLGAHYTSEKNILKLIKPLFLDELQKEFETAKESKPKLLKFHDKISRLCFLDPACGCGNFLIIAYCELRLLELEVIKVLLYKYEKLRPEVASEAGLDIGHLLKCDVDRFYGIEYEEFPSQIAQVAMWLMDHQMNQLVSLTFGEYYVRLPLQKSATIIHGNALQMDWQRLIQNNVYDIYAETTNIFSVSEPEVVYKTLNVFTNKINVMDGSSREEKVVTSSQPLKFDYIMGNPPFIGTAYQSTQQKSDMTKVFSGIQSYGMLDYVTAWYIKAAQCIQNTNTKVAFVSTNSISQGEQPAILWNVLFNLYKIKIHFAHRTFKWGNEGRRNAAVHVVIIGFANYDVSEKRLFEYENITAEPNEIKANNINPYLVEGNDNFIQKRTHPICNVPEISRGCDAIDDGNLLLNLEERNELLVKYPEAEKFIRPFLMGREFLNNIPRFCIWLKDVAPDKIRKFPLIYERIKKVKLFRQKSKRVQTLKAAKFPYLFGEIRQPESDYLAIPKVSSENRVYIPIAYCKEDVICGDKLFNLPNATKFHFGIITSLMHMAWIRYTCGRLESRYSYSNTIVYNNFPWPESPTQKQKQTVATAAQHVLDVRTKFPDSSLADLYDPNTMPPELVKAHQTLDKAVDLCYRSQPFINETKRIEFLFELYDKLTSGMFVKIKKKKQNG